MLKLCRDGVESESQEEPLDRSSATDRARLAARFPNSNMSAVHLGDYYALTGNSRRAVEWLARGYDEKKWTIFTIRFDKSIPPAFFDDPGWKALWERPLFKDRKAAHEEIATEHASGK